MGLNQIAADMYEATHHESKSFADPMKTQYYNGIEVNLENIKKLTILVKKYQNELHIKNEAFSKIIKLFTEYSNFLNNIDIDSNNVIYEHWKYGINMLKEFQNIMDKTLKEVENV